MTIPAEDRPLAVESPGDRKVHFTTCYMCACRCGIKVTVEDGRVRFIQGTRGHPVNDGVLCAKGSAGHHEAVLAGEAAQAAAAQAGRRARQRRVRGNRMGRGARDRRGAPCADSRDRSEAARVLHRPRPDAGADRVCGRSSSARPTGPRTAAFARSTWRRPDFTRSATRSGNSARRTGTAPSIFVLWGVAEDHSSNPIKIGLDKLKRRGAKFVSINPVRTGYSAIADEWVPVRPGTDGLLALAIVHVLLTDGTHRLRIPRALHECAVARRPGAGICRATGCSRAMPTGQPAGLRRARRQASIGELGPTDQAGAVRRPATLPDGRTVKTVLALAAERYLGVDMRRRRWPSACGSAGGDDRRASRAKWRTSRSSETIELPIAWTDAWGRRHDKVVGRPVAMYAMRGVSAHSNGFQTCRALHFIQMLLGALDGPGNFRARAPYPKPIPPQQLPATRPCAPDMPLARPPLGFPMRPGRSRDRRRRPAAAHRQGVFVGIAARRARPHAHGHRQRGGRRSLSDRHAAAVHGEHGVEFGDEHGGHARHARARKTDGSYKIPFVIVADAFASETVAFADLVLPDTTYLERYDAISLLDRPISEPDAPADAIRHPVVAARSRCAAVAGRAGRTRVAARVSRVHQRGRRRASSATTAISSSASSGRRASDSSPDGAATDGDNRCVGAPNPRQWEAYIENQSYFAYHAARANAVASLRQPPATSNSRKTSGFISEVEPIVMQLCSRAAAEIPAGGAGRIRRAAAARTRRTARGWRAISIRCRSGTRRSRCSERPIARRRLSVARADATADGDVSLVGCAERVAAADHCRQRAVHERRNRGENLASPTATGRGSSRTTASCVAASARWKASSPTRCGRGTRSASRPARGVSRRMRRRRRRGFLLNHLICRAPAAVPASRTAHHQFGSGHRPGGVVRPARAHHEVRGAARPGRPSAQFEALPARRHAAPPPCCAGADVKLGLVIDLDTCVGCHACATACKEWNGASAICGPLSDYDPYGAEPSGVWFNRVRHYEVGQYPAQQDDQLPDVVPALRGRGLRQRLSHGRLVQARRRHRARRPGQVHGLQPLRVGVPLRRARARRGSG